MIESNELRLGNWVKWEDSPVKTIAIKKNKLDVLVKSGDKQHIKNLDYNQISPYPVSPELLAVNGFKKNLLFPHLHAYTHEKYHLNINIVGHISEISFGLIPQNMGMIFQQNISLHQLQNLFYVLTNNELQVTFPIKQ